MTFTYPIKRNTQIFLTLYIALNISAPFLNIGILAIAEFFFSLCYKRSRMYGIRKLLLIKRNACNIYGFEPFLYFLLCAFTS